MIAAGVSPDRHEQLLLKSGPKGYIHFGQRDLSIMQERYFGKLNTSQSALVTQAFYTINKGWMNIRCVCGGNCSEDQWAYTKTPWVSNKLEMVLCPKYFSEDGITYSRLLTEERPTWCGGDSDARSSTIMHEALHLMTRQPHIPGRKRPTQHITDHDFRTAQAASPMRGKFSLPPRHHCRDFPEDCTIYGRDWAQQLKTLAPALTLTNADNYVFYAIDLMLGAMYPAGLKSVPRPGEAHARSVQDGLGGRSGPRTDEWHNDVLAEIERRKQRWTKVENGEWKWEFKPLI